MKTLKNYLEIMNMEFTTHIVNSDDTPVHKHPFYEIFYILSGQIDHKLNEEVKTLNINSLCLIRPNDSHAFIRDKNNTSAHRDILIGKELFKKTCDFISPSLFSKIENSPTGFITELSLDEINIIERQFVKYNDLKSMLNKDILIAQSSIICLNILSYFYLHIISQNQSKNKEIIKKLITELNNKDNFNKSMNEIINSFHYNSSYISRIFSQQTGICLTDYFNNCKVNYSSQLLKCTNLSITEIAIQSGFNNLTYFNKVFKKITGYTPSVYRKKFLLYN